VQRVGRSHRGVWVGRGRESRRRRDDEGDHVVVEDAAVIFTFGGGREIVHGVAVRDGRVDEWCLCTTRLYAGRRRRTRSAGHKVRVGCGRESRLGCGW
jgi:hypothetical protein